MSTVRTRAFTLIELLVVVAIIALLIGILLPSLRAARETARQIVCSNNARQVGLGMQTYTADNKEWIPGVNTSGWEGQLLGGSNYTGDRSGETPTTTWDFVSPSWGDSAGLSPNRAARTKQIFERFGCPSVTAFNTTLFGGAADRTDFETIHFSTPYKAVSFLSPASFHRYPNSAAADRNRRNGQRPNFTPDSQQNPVAVNPNYQPRLDLIGAQPSNKVWVADGTRYLENGQLDFDISPAADTFSSFCDSGPIFTGSTAYGRQGPGAPVNLPLSYRHNKGIDVNYFDGHTAKMTQEASWKDPAPWYPGNSRFNGTNGTPESVGFFGVNKIIP